MPQPSTPDKYSSQFYPQADKEAPVNESQVQGSGNSNETGSSNAFPVVQMPKGGGAIKGIGEKFQANPVTGTGSTSIPLPLTPGRGGFTPSLNLGYDSGAGNGAFGLGWGIGLPSITRKTDKGLPEYEDDFESDTYILAGAEDLVRKCDSNGNLLMPVAKSIGSNEFNIYQYIPRTEGLFAKIERWKNIETGISHWKVTTKDNISTVYGYNAAARISNAESPQQVFQWMIERSADNKGNLTEYHYKRENNQNITPSMFEDHRLESGSAFTNLYLKKVCYGNGTMSNDLYTVYAGTWHYALVLDYGEHTGDVPVFNENGTWLCRDDAFSTYRAGFEIRTYRLCNRIIMFHHFTQTGTNPVAVKILRLEHDLRPELALLTGVTLSGVNPDNATLESFPPLTFSYSQAQVGTELKRVDDTDLKGYTAGSSYSWVDLYGEGLSGLLLQDSSSWYYKRNYGDKAIYDPAAVDGNGVWLAGMAPLPKVPALRGQPLMVGDLDGNGKTDIQVMTPELKGYYEFSGDLNLQAFESFRAVPNIDFNDPNLRMLDLTGDGHADVMITENECFSLYNSLAKLGYSENYRLPKPTDENQGPKLVFADRYQQVFTADMSGDGLQDIVRIKNGAVDYWPNLGYGRFGHKVSMKNSPKYDQPGEIEGNRIRLADVDGTGTTDIIYLGTDTIRYWKNQSGNSFGDEIKIECFPAFNALSDISVMDLLGKGTSCIVNITPQQPGFSTRIQYLELTSGIKPFLMESMDNNMGAVTSFFYKPSTEFYLKDKITGKSWVTKLPFPVHVVERVRIEDGPGGTSYETRYAYHHGYFDGNEREFRGFGMVEQWDSILSISEELMQAPVLTKTWFHTGFFSEKENISQQYITEYYSEDTEAWLLEDTTLPEDLEATELREACRALKGSILRQEIYGLDESEDEGNPYTVAEKNYLIRKLQSKGENKHCVFHVIEQESLAYNYERNPSDPRIEHSIVMATDELGNILESATINYPRRTYQNDKPDQNRLLIQYREDSFINVLDNINFYRHSVPLTQKSFQLHEVTAQGKITRENLVGWKQQATSLTNHQQPSTGVISLRALTDVRIRYYNEACNGVLTAGQIASHGLPYHSLSLAYTDNCIQNLITFNSGNINPLFPSTVSGFATLLTASGYVQETEGYRKPSMRISFDTTKFYLPVKQTDPLGNETEIAYDSYALLPVSTTDALDFVTSIDNDYRICQSSEITDPNGSVTLVKYNALGMVIAMAQDGASNEGDTLESPTIAYEYELLNWLDDNQPVMVHVQAKEEHQLTTTGWLHSYTYSDGLGRELQTKVQAEDGTAWVMQNGVPVQIDDITDRFVATGRKIYNNKGNVIKQYEPWFSATHLYEPEAELTQYGVTPIMHYDAPGRLIKTEFPDGTLSRVEFDAWQQKTFDRNDCVNGSDWLTAMQQGTTAQQRAATLAQAHNNTPQVTDLDTMGRPYRITDDAGNQNYFVTLNHIDIASLTVKVTDAKGRDMTHHVYDMTGQLCYTFNIDSGRRWIIVNALDKPLHTWDNLLRKTTIQYDVLNRPAATLLYNNSTTALKVEAITYGTSATGYTIGKPVIVRDQSGKLEFTEYDFKGNLLSSSRRLCSDYNIIIDWFSCPDPTGESFDTEFTFDAMNRPVTETTPDGKVRTYEYNKAGLLERVLLDEVEYVSNIEYNEKGQRTDIYFGNGSKTRYDYDTTNFRLTRLLTTRNNGTVILQDLNYIYDPEGNVVQQDDNAQQTNYFSNTVIAPVGKYEYDALYRIIKAEGRELTGLGMANETDFVNDIHSPNAGSNQMQNYTQLYSYDELGNIGHVESQGRWNRIYTYDINTNRLLNTGSGYNYTYDAHGNMVSMPHLGTMEWDYRGNLTKTICGTVTTYYRYDPNGNRVRKIAHKTGAVTEERIYIGNYELYRKKVGGTLNTERETTFVSDDKKRIAIVDTRNVPTPVEVTIRYQYDNHLGSACLELDGSGAVISYEEYHPFGTTSYRAGRNAIETSLKRYKYVGKERDEETGLYYYGARYYAAWLCRFVSVDPLQFDFPQLTPYNYAGNKPITHLDLDGRQSTGDKPYGSEKERNKPFEIYKIGAIVENKYGSWLLGSRGWIKTSIESRFLDPSAVTLRDNTNLQSYYITNSTLNKSTVDYKDVLNTSIDAFESSYRIFSENYRSSKNGRIIERGINSSKLDDLYQGYKFVKKTGTYIDIGTAVYEGMRIYSETKQAQDFLTVTSSSIIISANPYVSFFVGFSSLVQESDEFKQMMLNNYQ